jgi:hypothetical protein
MRVLKLECQAEAGTWLILGLSFAFMAQPFAFFAVRH